jgi:hypothetical protein
MSETGDAIYTERKAVVGVAIGGPLAGAYYFWRTLSTLGRPGQAVLVAVGAFVLLSVTFATAFVPPLDRIPSFAFWAIQIGLTYGLYSGLLASDVAEHLESGKPAFGWPNTLAVAAIALVITAGAIVLLLYTMGAFTGHSTRYYGKLQHEIVFDETNISVAEIDRLAIALETAGFFDYELQKTVDAAEVRGRYILTLYVTEDAAEAEFLELVKELRSDVQRSFPGKRIVIDLVVGTPDKRIARIE